MTWNIFLKFISESALIRNEGYFVEKELRDRIGIWKSVKHINFKKFQNKGSFFITKFQKIPLTVFKNYFTFLS